MATVATEQYTEAGGRHWPPWHCTVVSQRRPSESATLDKLDSHLFVGMGKRKAKARRKAQQQQQTRKKKASSGSSDSGVLWECSVCKDSIPKRHFPKSQRSRPAELRCCKDCAVRSLPHPSPPPHPHPHTTLTQHTQPTLLHTPIPTTSTLLSQPPPSPSPSPFPHPIPHPHAHRSRQTHLVFFPFLSFPLLFPPPLNLFPPLQVFPPLLPPPPPPPDNIIPTGLAAVHFA